VLAPAVSVKLPPFVIVTGPKLAVMRLPLMVIVEPARAIPPTALVLRDPSIVMPPLATCRIDAAVILAAETLFAFVMTSAPSGNPPPPTTPENRRLPPLPRFKVRASVPLSALLKVMFVPLAWVSKSVVPVKFTAEENEMAPPTENVPAKDTPPAPVCVKAPAIEPPPVRVNVPEFCIARGPEPVVVIALPRVNVDPMRLIPAPALVVSAPKLVDPAN